METKADCIIYTDGACKGNPGVGGYAALLMLGDDIRKVVSGGEAHTTNNRMELTAVVKSLEYASEIEGVKSVTLYTDSQYISRAINENWLSKWLDNGFEKIKNKDLWLRVWKYVCMLDVTFIWVKGHGDNVGNIIVDKLATQACYFQGKPFDYLGTF